jgi:hypothetical protein
MTIPEYKGKYGPTLRKHAEEEWFIALMKVLEGKAHLMAQFRDTVNDNLLLQGAPIYLNQIFGYDKCIEVIRQLKSEDKAQPPEVPDNYQS